MRKWAGLLLVLFLAFGLSACNDQKTSGSSSTQTLLNQEASFTATLQGTIFDATTGARMHGDDLTITLIKGADYVGPASFRNDVNDTFSGDFAFTDIPITLTAGKATYRVMVTCTGYQTFEAYVTYTAALNANNTFDTNYNFVGNIYMFPKGATASDLKVTVTYDGKAVSGATVYLQQNINNNVKTTATTTLINAVGGTLAELSATTDANGIATFAGADLVLGGNYTPVVLPIALSSGVQLAKTAGAAVTIGDNNTPYWQAIAMNDVVPGANANGLYVVSRTPADVEDILATGILKITFNRAVALPTVGAAAGNNPDAALGNYLGNAVFAALNATTDCTVALDATDTTNKTITITPNWLTTPVAFTGTNAATADIGLQITYSNVFVKLSGDDTSELISVFGLTDVNTGAAVSGVVRITGPDGDE